MTDESEEKWSGNPMLRLNFGGHEYILKSAYDALRLEYEKLEARNRLLLASLADTRREPTSAYEIERDRSADDEIWDIGGKDRL
jgi:hypothetical protein